MNHMIEVIYTSPEQDGAPFRFKVYEGDGGYKKVLQGVALGNGRFQYWIPDCGANRQLLATANKKAFSYTLPEDVTAGNKPSIKEQELEKELAELKAKLKEPQPDAGTKRVIKRPELIALLKTNEIPYDVKARNIELFGLLPDELTANIQLS